MTKQLTTILEPRNRDEATALLSEYALIESEIQAIESQNNEALSRVKAEVASIIDPKKARLEAITAAVKTYANIHRLELTDGGKSKSASLGAAEIGWRSNPSKIEFENEDQAIKAMLGKKSLKDFVSITYKISRDALKKLPEKIKAIPGARLVAGEENFFIKTGGAK